MKNLIEFIFFKFFAIFILFVKWENIPKVGKIFGNILFHVLKSRKSVAIENLKFAFPNKTNQEIFQIAKESFYSVAITFLELIKLKKTSFDKLINQLDLSNVSEFRKLINPENGTIILSSHFGNWEILASLLKFLTEKESLIVVQKQRNDFIDNFLNSCRLKFGSKITYLDSAPRDVLKYLSENKIVAMIADQSARKEEMMIPFFGREAPTHRGPAIFSLRTGAQIIFTILKRMETGKYKLFFERINSENLIGSNEENIYQLTLRHVQLLEKILVETPEQWLWGHKRWKHSQ